VPVWAISVAAARNPAQAVRASVPPTLMRRTPSAAASATVRNGALISRLSGLGATAGVLAAGLLFAAGAGVAGAGAGTGADGVRKGSGWVLADGPAIAAVGVGAEPEAEERVDLGGAVVTPGLVNTHHHLYQTLTRARAQEADLFTWLRELYPVWAGIDAEAEYAAARTGLAELALSGCTTVFDHHYVFPRGRTGLVEAEVQAARELGVRIVASRGSMDLGVSDGGLPPDELVEELDAVLAETERLAAFRICSSSA